MRESRPERYDVVVVGSGFGGVMVAHELVRAGQQVLLLERGGWDERPPEGVDDVWDFFQHRASYVARGYRVHGGGRPGWEGICACVGGASVFYGGVSLRLRREDFDPQPQLTGESGAAWPVGYEALEPYYSRAEQLLDVAGEAGVDPTEPPRSAPYPRAPAPLSPISRRMAEAARRRGLHPFRLPLALDESCTRTTSCDGYPAAGLGRIVREALLPAPGFELRTGARVTRLDAKQGRVTAVEYVEPATGARHTVRAGRVVLAAGALASPHLLLASGLPAVNPGGATVGRYLMRHCNAFVYGVFARLPEPGRFHKQVAIHDFYWSGGGPRGRKLGNLQQVMHPQLGGLLGVPARLAGRGGAAGRALVGAMAGLARQLAHRLTGLQVIAEDQPRAQNRVELDAGATDAWGVPRALVRHRYTRRDLEARAELVRHARAVLREAGALGCITYPVQTFSHAVGTVRMGVDPATSALDEHCRFRGLENLYVVDGSFMPTSGGVNPSLTIAANALRVGDHLVRGT